MAREAAGERADARITILFRASARAGRATSIFREWTEPRGGQASASTRWVGQPTGSVRQWRTMRTPGARVKRSWPHTLSALRPLPARCGERVSAVSYVLHLRSKLVLCIDLRW